jgi:hypothetical protein
LLSINTPPYIAAATNPPMKERIVKAAIKEQWGTGFAITLETLSHILNPGNNATHFLFHAWQGSKPTANAFARAHAGSLGFMLCSCKFCTHLKSPSAASC